MSKRELSIGILVDEHLRIYDTTRKPSKSFLNRLETIIMMKAFPPQNEVRGHIIAADTIIDAFIKYGTMGRYELFCFPWGRAAASERLKAYSDAQPGAHRVGITSMDSAIKTGGSKPKVEAWFNPFLFNYDNGGIEISQRMRRSYLPALFPITTLVHGLSIDWMLYDSYLRFLLAEMLPCDSLICSSRASRQAANNILLFLSEHFNEEFGTTLKYNGRFDVIPLCVDTSDLQPKPKVQCRRTLKLPLDSFIILYLGRISPLKADLYPLLEVIKTLVEANLTRTLLLVIAGSEEGNYTELLKERARSMGLLRNVRIMLNTSDEVKQLLLPAADVFVSPSDSVQESFGLTPIEAMACGVPQIVPDWDGYRDTVVHGETGFLVPTYWARCHDDLTDSGVVAGWMFDHLSLGQSVAVSMSKTQEYLQCLIANDELRLRMSDLSRRRALSVYGCEPVVGHYEDLWLELAEIASQTQPRDRQSNFDQPRYHDFFGHYASVSLSDDSWLRITPSGAMVASAAKILPPAPHSLSDLWILDENALRATLALLLEGEKHSGAHQPSVGADKVCRWQMGELVKFLSAGFRHHADHLRRHIMWLIKYGYLEPVSKQ